MALGNLTKPNFHNNKKKQTLSDNSVASEGNYRNNEKNKMLPKNDNEREEEIQTGIYFSLDFGQS